jgi:hypothetical protein
MKGRVKGLTAVGLAAALVTTGLTPGGTPIALAEDVSATQVQLVETWQWSPASPDPSGITYIPETGRLIVVDSEVEEPTGAGWHDVNLWEYSIADEEIQSTGEVPSGEPTGLDYDPERNWLFVSDDDEFTLMVIDIGNDGVYGTPDDGGVVGIVDLPTINGSDADAEDPAFDPTTGHLYVMSGAHAVMFRIDPVDGTFGNGNDDIAQIDVGHLHPDDNFEGLAYDFRTDHLLVGGQETNLIWEIDKNSGDLIRIIDASSVPDLVYISGLSVAPASSGSGWNLWVVDRVVDNSPLFEDENDGRLLELFVPAAGPEAPVAHDQEVFTTPGASKAITLVATDANGDDLTYEIATEPDNGLLDIGAIPDVVYTPEGGFSGVDTFTFTADDGISGFSNTATVTVNVQANQNPALAEITTPRAAPEGVTHAFAATATDPEDNTPLTFSLVNPPAGANITSGGAFSWTPTEAQGPGSYPFTVIVTDSLGGSDTQPVTINVTEVNRPPVVANPGTLGHGEGDTVDITIGWSDPDLPANTVSWSASGLPQGVSINSQGRIVGTLPAGSASGSPFNVTVTATDNGSPNLQDSESFAWIVTDTNNSPVLGPIGNKSVAQGSTLAFTATATDPNGDNLTFSLVSPPSGALITPGGSFTFTPNVAPGNYPVTIRVTDDGNPILSDQETFIVTVETAPSSPPQTPDPSPDPLDPFIDDDGHIFESAIAWLSAEGITSGCNPPANTKFCPDDRVTRGEMAAFLVRANGYSLIADDFFVDDNGSVFENAINRLRSAGVTQGCNPPANNRYCPDEFVTRGQMAAFLVRAFDYSDSGSGDHFVDDNNSIFENAIDKLRVAGVTLGCNPPANDRFCPNDFVTRGQMAAFLKRALDG